MQLSGLVIMYWFLVIYLIIVLCWTWYLKSVIPVLWEPEAGGSQITGQPGQLRNFDYFSKQQQQQKGLEMFKMKEPADSMCDEGLLFVSVMIIFTVPFGGHKRQRKLV